MEVSNGQIGAVARAEPNSTTPGRVFATDWAICAAALLLFVFAASRFFSSAYFGTILNSDASVPVLLAEEMLRKGSLLPSTWYYVNGEIWILSPQIFALPFVATIGASTLALKLGNIVAIVSMVGAFMLPIQRIARSWPFSLTVALGVIAIFSRNHVEAIYEQAAYGWFSAKLALLIFFSLRALSGASERSKVSRRFTSWNSIFYALLLVEFTASNPARAAVYWAIPITIACILLPSSWPRSGRSFLIGLTCLAFLGGGILHLALGRYLLVVPGVGALQPVAQWPAHLAAVWTELPLLVQYQTAWPSTALDLTWASAVARYIFFAGAALTMILAWRRTPIECAEGFFARLAATMFALVFLALIVGVDVMAPRYLVPPVLISLAAFMTTIRRWLSVHHRTRAIITALFVLAFCGGGALLAATFPSGAASADCDASPKICGLRGALQQLRLRKGYATYWNANVTTLASAGDITVCPIGGSRLLPLHWLVSKDCFTPPQRSDRYFIALSRSQTTQSDRQVVVADAGSPDSTVIAGDYEIWIYEAGDHRVDWLMR